MAGRCEEVRHRWRCQREAARFPAADGRMLCWQHAAIAARKAAEEAEEAAYWEKMFTPRPGQGYRADPEWQAAKRVQLADPPLDDGYDPLPGQMAAICRIREIETAWKARGGS